MAPRPTTGDTPATTPATPAPKINPFLQWLGGKFTFGPGSSTSYPRMTGWGAKKTPHPDGGTNTKEASVIFVPIAGLPSFVVEGSIYVERWQARDSEGRALFVDENGNPTTDAKTGKKLMKISRNVSLGMIKPDRRDAHSADYLEDLKAEIRTAYNAHRKAAGADTTGTLVRVRKPASEWTETETE